MDQATTPKGPQHLRALARANEVRLARADLKRRVAEGELSVAEIVCDAPWEAETMTVADLLMTQRRWGRSRCRKLLLSIPMTEHRTVGSMTDRQRAAVAAALATQQPDAATRHAALVRREPVLV